MSYIPLGRLNEAKATGAEALAKNLDSPFLRAELYEVAFLENDAPGMAQQLHGLLARREPKTSCSRWNPTPPRIPVR
jgi:hypothetical protein